MAALAKLLPHDPPDEESAHRESKSGHHTDAHEHARQSTVVAMSFSWALSMLSGCGDAGASRSGAQAHVTRLEETETVYEPPVPANDAAVVASDDEEEAEAITLVTKKNDPFVRHARRRLLYTGSAANDNARSPAIAELAAAEQARRDAAAEQAARIENAPAPAAIATDPSPRFEAPRRPRPRAADNSWQAPSAPPSNAGTGYQGSSWFSSGGSGCTGSGCYGSSAPTPPPAWGARY